MEGLVEITVHWNMYFIWQDKKRLYALVCESLKYESVLTEILEISELLKREKSFKGSRWLAKVLAYDVVFGKGIKAASAKYQVL